MGLLVVARRKFIYQYLKNFVSRGYDCLILVPEISLTPQMIDRVREQFDNDVVIYHSKLTTNERFTEWQKLIVVKLRLL